MPIVAISIAALVVPALAQQETPSVEIFGGYQFSHFTPSINVNGWNTAVTGNVNRWFGITGDELSHNFSLLLNSLDSLPHPAANPKSGPALRAHTGLSMHRKSSQ
jgi:hypothetical protein